MVPEHGPAWACSNMLQHGAWAECVSESLLLCERAKYSYARALCWSDIDQMHEAFIRLRAVLHAAITSRVSG